MGSASGTLGLLMALAAALSPPASQPADGAGVVRRQDNPWSLLFADEFNGGSLDRDKWEAQIANGCQYGIPGWGNGELQYYTDLQANLRVTGGQLVLTAANDPAAAAVPNQPYTSARVRTFGKFAVGPSAAHPTVKVEARIKVPAGPGLWPAFWLLPETNATAVCSGCGRHGVWAASGEIDVMEAANEATTVLGTLHYGAPWPQNAYHSNNVTLPDGASFAAAFHTFGLEWEAKEIRWYVDGQLFATQQSGNGTRDGWFSLGPGATTAPDAAPLPGDAPFGTQRFYIILNLALGSESTPFTRRPSGAGITAAELNATLAQPQSMLVDWVRVWGKAAA